MNRQELFNQVKSWLEAEKLAFIADDEGSFILQINANNCRFQLNLQCEDEPTLLQVLCWFSLKVPPEKVAEAGLLVHNINARLRLGVFQFDVEERVVGFRLAMPIRPEADLAEQFTQSITTTLRTVDEQVRTFGLLACSVAAAQQELAKLTPTAGAGDANPSLVSGRMELN